MNLLPLARLDLIEAETYYRESSDDLADRFIREAVEVIDYVTARPKLFAYRRKPVRAVLLPSFPFMVYYIETHQRHVNIIAVMHTSRSPNEWRRRPWE